MRVAMISPYPAADVPPRGGVEVSAVRLVEGLVAQGVHVDVISTGTPARETRDGIVVHRARARRLTTARLLVPWRADVRRILSCLQIDLVHGQGLMPPGVAATDVPASRCPRVVTAHGNRRKDAHSDYTGPSALLRGALVGRLSGMAARRADIVIGVHPDWRINVPVQPRRYAFVPNIVDEVFFGAERRPRSGRVLYCGGSAAIKGWELLVRAWPYLLQEVPFAHLEGTRFRTEERDPAHAIAGAEIRGWLTSQELCAAMEQAEVVVMPSRFEVSPVLVTEAWAAGVPVVAASVGGIPGMAGGAAVLVEREPKAFARAIADVLLRRVDVDALVAVGRARAEACQRESVVGAHIQIYRELAA
jgi:glycosyltransferase involved in cell wall biosynthesis